MDEVQYNRIYWIRASSESLSIKTRDGKMIFAQLPFQRGWLWISKEVTAEDGHSRCL